MLLETVANNKKLQRQTILAAAVISGLFSFNQAAYPRQLELNAEPSKELAITIREVIQTHQQSKRAKHASESLEANKIDPRLRGFLGASKFDQKHSALLKTKGELTEIVIELEGSLPSTIAALEALEIEITLTSGQHKLIKAWASANQIQQVATLEAVKKVRPPIYAQPRSGSVVTEGDAILNSAQVRNMGFMGQGIKVGIISDGANNFSDAVASGDLPENLTRFGTCEVGEDQLVQCRRAGSCNEGTAMAEIIHDIAPGAELAVASVADDAEFLVQLDQLVSEFGADIIVDDLGFFGEPYFEDGQLALAVNALPADVLYVSAAGNSANIHYEADFKLGFDFNFSPHEFAPGDNIMNIDVPARSFVVAILQWNQPFENPQSDYDLFVFNNSGNDAISAARQNGSGTNPIEAVCIPNESSTDRTDFLIVDRFSGNSDRLELFTLGSRGIEYPVPQGSVFGHPGVPKAIAVGTINASDNNNDTIAFYSSRGPSRIDFPAIEQRAKPDVTGIDGVTVTGAGGFFSPFFGTSAAAPHVAGIAALLMSAGENISAAEVRRALEQNAIDLGDAGRDDIYGLGRVDALAAKQALRIAIPLPPFQILLFDDD